MQRANKVVFLDLYIGAIALAQYYPLCRCQSEDLLKLLKADSLIGVCKVERIVREWWYTEYTIRR